MVTLLILPRRLQKMMRSRTFAKYLFSLLLVFMAEVLAAPDVREYIPLKSDRFELPETGNVAYAKYRKVAEWLAAELSLIAGHWGTVDTNKAGEATIQLLPLSGVANVPYKNNDSRFSESYRIEIGDEVKIYAGGRAGARYAVRKLMELLGKEKRLDAAILIDYPDYRWRGVVIKPGNTPCEDPLRMSDQEREVWLECMKSKIDSFAKIRLNLLGLISPMFNRMSDEDVLLLKRLFLYARENNVEPMPIIDTKLWGIPAKQLKVDAIEGIYHEKQPFTVREGYLVADTETEAGPVQWTQGADSDQSWKDQSNRGDRWRINESHGPRKGKPLKFVIELDGKDNPWKNSLLLKHPSTGKRIRVQPNSYYELGIRVKADARKSGGVFVGVDQYDRAGSRIKGMNRYPVKIQGRKDTYIKRWVPVFTSSDTHSLLIRLAPEVKSAQPGLIEVGDVEIRPMRAELINVLDNKETSPVVTSEDGKTVYRNGVDYEVVDLTIKEWRGYPFEKIQRMRIKVKSGSILKEGGRISLSYDGLPLEYRAIPRSMYSAASKYTYEEFSRLFRQLGKLSPRFIKVSFSEHHGGLNRDSRSRRLGKSNRDLLISYMNTLDRLLRLDEAVTTPGGYQLDGVGIGSAKLVVWDDMLNPWHHGQDTLYQVAFGGQVGAGGILPAGDAEAGLSKSIWLSAWWYQDDDKKRIVEKTPDFYSKKGFNFFVSTWYQKGGIKNWLKVADPEKVQGLLATTWNGNEAGVKTIACAGWNRESYSSCLMRE